LRLDAMPSSRYTIVVPLLDSSTVEHPAVNRRVAGSNPARGAIICACSSVVERSAHNRLVGCSNHPGRTNFKWPHGQVVKIPPFQGGDTGSSPVGATSFILGKLRNNLWGVLEYLHLQDLLEYKTFSRHKSHSNNTYSSNSWLSDFYQDNTCSSNTRLSDSYLNNIYQATL
jgi:FAD/FMN-containing dehydrogenase